jgi:uncharacterized membrane protein
MKRTLTAYFSTLLAFLILDGIWLGVLMGPTYRTWLGPLMLEKPVIGPAVAFYLLYAAGLVVFAVQSGLRRHSLSHAIKRGALLGLVAYGTYDLSNWATLQGWPAQMALVDLLWGTVASAIAAGVSYQVTRRVV